VIKKIMTQIRKGKYCLIRPNVGTVMKLDKSSSGTEECGKRRKIFTK
jgi:hypothetical protein